MMASKIRKKKQSRWRAEARRRWQDLQQAKQQKYTGPWKRRDRRRQAFQIMKTRLKIVREYRNRSLPPYFTEDFLKSSALNGVSCQH